MNKLGANPMKSIVAVGELAIPPDCDSGRCGFKPRRSPLVFIKDYPYDDNMRFRYLYIKRRSPNGMASDF